MLTRREFIKTAGKCGLLCALSPALTSLCRPLMAETSSGNLLEAKFYEKASNGDVRCGLCPQKCVLSPNQESFCRVRVNKNGVLYTKAYNNPCVLSPDPVEKGPLYHFLPGTTTLSLGTAGCNLRCLYCQNSDAAQYPPEKTKNIAISAREIANKAKEKNYCSITYTYTEPVIYYEYLCAISEAAREKKLYKIMVTAGYINPGPFKLLVPYVDAVVFGLKGFNNNFYQKVCGGELKPVLEALATIAREKVWLEITTLLVPGLNDDMKEIRQMCQWIKENIGTKTPLHFSRFFPSYKLKNLPQTPLKTMECARNIAMEAGLKYVYLDNVPGHEGNNTHCHNCHKPILERVGFEILKTGKMTADGTCKLCGTKQPGIWM